MMLSERTDYSFWLTTFLCERLRHRLPHMMSAVRDWWDFTSSWSVFRASNFYLIKCFICISSHLRLVSNSAILMCSALIWCLKWCYLI